MNKFETDIVVIGAGPVGLFAVFEAGQLNMNCHVIDCLDFIGGQCQALYPEKPIYDIPAYPFIKSQDLILKLEEQIKPHNPVFHLSTQVVKITGEVGNFNIITNNDKIISCKAVIIAAGCGSFGPNRPPLKDIKIYENSGSVRYLVNQIANFEGKNIVIAGGGDSAVDWALSLAPVANKLSLVHRRNKFRAAPNSVNQLNELVSHKKIELIVPYQLDSLKGLDGNLTHVIVADLNNEKKEIEADYLLPFYGLSMDLGPIIDWGLNFNKKHIIVTPHSMETNIEGVFAIGDIADYKGKLKLILTGFSEAAFACHNIYNYVFPDTPLHFEYSTTKGVIA
jgi:thioredoxin reductase (NADPH)